MTSLMITIVSLSVSGSIFIVILILCKPFLKDRASKRWQYYVWLIIIIRLLFPFSLEINFIGSLFSAIPLFPQSQILLNFLPYFWLIWIIVAIVLFVRKITIYQSFVRYIKAGRTPVTDFENLEQFGKIVEQINIRGTVGFYTNNLISTPLLIGFFRPYIVLPTLDISESDFRYTVLHELNHYRRGDMFYKWLVQFTMCLHWFNPFVYIMNEEINNACEFACDESVIKDLDYQGMRAYGNTLLNSLGMGGEYKSSISAVTLNENTKILKQRLDMLMCFKKKSKYAVVTTLFATILLGMGATMAGAYTGSAYSNLNISNTHFSNDDDIQVIDVSMENLVMQQHNVIANLQLGDKVTYDIQHNDIFLSIMVADAVNSNDINDIFIFLERENESRGSFTVSSIDIGEILTERGNDGRDSFTINSAYSKYLLLFPVGDGQTITGTITIQKSDNGISD